MTNGGHGDSAREAYDRWRPPYPPTLWALLDDQWGPSRELAIDLGAGTGAATRVLARRFDRVLAVEPDVALLDWPDPPDNVERLPLRAGDVGFADHTVDAVTIASALHWMDVDHVLPDVARWLRPTGLLAAWRLEMPAFDGPLGALVDDELAMGWDQLRHPRLRAHGWTSRAVQACPVLRTELATELVERVAFEPEEVVGFLCSVSFVQAYAARSGDPDYLARLEARVLEAAGGLTVTGSLRFDLVVARPLG
ncbi:MAG: class I SAM-dependent methyltransferase [Alphaproteobacteria bacterium]|nr:class I SAM-dependent methyltransferase [Alphaproteobacteria bacterium]